MPLQQNFCILESGLYQFTDYFTKKNARKFPHKQYIPKGFYTGIKILTFFGKNCGMHEALHHEMDITIIQQFAQTKQYGLKNTGQVTEFSR